MQQHATYLLQEGNLQMARAWALGGLQGILQGSTGCLVPPDVQQAEARTYIPFHALWQTNDLHSCHHRQKLAGWMVSLDVLLQEQANCADYSGEWQVCAKEYSLLITALFLQLFMNKSDTILRFWDQQSRRKLNRLTLKACLFSEPQTLLYIQVSRTEILFWTSMLNLTKSKL